MMKLSAGPGMAADVEEEKTGMFNAANLKKGVAALKIAKAAGASPSGGILGGATEGALAGSSFGPKGAIIGGAVGAVKGVLGAKSARKAAKAKATSEMHQRQVGIEQEKAARLQAAFQSMAGNLGNIIR